MKDSIGKSLIFFLFIITLLSSMPAFSGNRAALVGKVDFKGNIVFDKPQLLKAVTMAAGQRYVPSQLSVSIDNIERYFSRKGYLFARVDSVNIRFTNDSSKVDIVFWIESGRQTMWGEIRIKSDSISTEFYKKYVRGLKNSPYSESRLEERITEMLEAAADSGFAFAQAEVGDIVLRREKKGSYADVTVYIHENHRIRINQILFSGNKNTRDYVLRRETAINRGVLYSRKALDDAEQSLKNLSILRSVDAPQVYKSNGDSVDILINVEEGNAANFDGVIGYMPANPNDEQSGGYFTGIVDVSFNNLFGTARSFSVNWKKADTLSEEFHVRYTEPWVFDFPVNLSLGLDRMVRDTLYIEWNYNFNLRMRLLKNIIVFTELRRRSVTPDSASSRNNRLTNNDITDIEFGFQYDTRDYRLNPMSGLFYKASITYGLKKVNGPAYIIEEDNLRVRDELQSYEMYFEWYQNIWHNQVFSLKLSGMHISGSNIQMSDYFWFGGFRTLRGYRENQFSGDKAAWANLEYRFLVGKNSRVFLFNDWGFVDSPQVSGSLLPGYGMGIRFETGIGILEVDYGLGKGDGFGEGKIHFGVINNF